MGTSGRGIGQVLGNKLYEVATELVRAGIQDPAVLELVGLIEDGIGPDMVSDMLANIIAPDLARYTERITKSLKVKVPLLRFKIQREEFKLPSYQVGSALTPLILVPRSIVRPLIAIGDWDDVGRAAALNAAVRAEMNNLIGRAWSKVSVEEKKHALRQTLLCNPEIAKEFIATFLASHADNYDFEVDPAGLLGWLESARVAATLHSLVLTLPERPTQDQFYRVIKTICLQFQKLIEDNSLSDLLYNDDTGKPKHELATQRLFFGIAHAYCAANDLDLAREPNAGRGPVDFKLTRGQNYRVIVEVKLDRNPKLRDGYFKQLDAYMNAEATIRAIYLVVRVSEKGRAVEELEKEILALRAAGKNCPEIIVIDGRKKLSASKL